MGRRVAGVAGLLLAGAPGARAAERPVAAEVGGDLKTFFVAVFPYDSAIMPDDPAGSGVWSLRLKGRAGVGSGQRSLAAVAHLASVATAPGASAWSAAFGGANLTGAGAVGTPELVDLSWTLDGSGDLAWTARPDWLYLRGDVPHLRATVGRQPVSFGHGLLFTPLDLVAPFQPTTLDPEYKPGADAVRVDAFAGMAGQLSLVGAWAGGWDRAGLVAVAYAQDTVGVWDLGAMLGSVRGDAVLGFTAAGSAGSVALRAEGTLTRPDEGEAFVRALAGADALPTEETRLTAEVYYQSLGATDPADYLRQATDPRYAAGELWELGRLYAGLAGHWDATPLVGLDAFAIANLLDRSALLGPGLTWSAAASASVSAGLYAAVGRRPEESGVSAGIGSVPGGGLGGGAGAGSIVVRSEFGLVPTLGFVTMSAAF